MTQTIKVKKGFDIPINGHASDKTTTLKGALFAIMPADYPGHLWKCLVKAGDRVKAGSPLMTDKATGRINLVAPAGGTIREVRRGERRRILAVVIEADADAGSENFTIPSGDPDLLRALLQQTGLWVLMRQRPFDIVPEADSTPRDIFITAFDSAPLAPQVIGTERYDDLERGIKALATLTSGKVYIGLRPDQHFHSHAAEELTVSGPHPAGNAGVQIAAVRPVNKGETVWTLSADSVARIGRLLSTGQSDWSTTVAVTGPAAVDPHLVATTAGISLQELLRGFLPDKADNAGSRVRVISGNPLTGIRENHVGGFLHFPWRQVTLIAEGDQADEFMGWASMSPSKFSVAHTFPAFLAPKRKLFNFDARIKGGHRAMILSGEYDKVFPFDIYPEYLIKAILAGDIDRMEKLGIYEVAPEDFALPEFVDTSKNELQKIVREGLDKLRSEE